MKVSDFFLPVKLPYEFDNDSLLGNHIAIFDDVLNFPSLKGIDIAIISVEESRNSNVASENSAENIKNYLYYLYRGDFSPKIADLGYLKIGNSVEDTYTSLSVVMAELIKKGIIPIILGGSQDLSYAMYSAYAMLERSINLVCIDNNLDLGDPEENIDFQSYLSKILIESPNYLLSYANIGLQKYLNDSKSSDLMEHMNFEVCRLGAFHEDINEAAAIIRNAHCVSFDIAAIKHSDASANPNNSVFGISGEEACKLAQFAGLSERLSSFGVFDYAPNLDEDCKTAQMIAIMLWHFIDAFYGRKNEVVSENPESIVKSIVLLETVVDKKIVFYHSSITDRWWIEIPHSPKFEKSKEKLYILPCNKKDYELASNSIVPNRYLLALRRFE
jgi:arginase family enzyme